MNLQPAYPGPRKADDAETERQTRERESAKPGATPEEALNTVRPTEPSRRQGGEDGNSGD